MAPPEPTPPPIKLTVALLPVATLLAALVGVLVLLPRVEPGFEGSGHLPLVLAATVAGLLGHRAGFTFDELQEGIIGALSKAAGAIYILLTIGVLIGVWVAAGVVPALVLWGLELMSPAYFLPTTCLVCSVVSLASGSSWSTAGTVGLALVGVGEAMSINPAMTAGAVISGAYFGDKLSPLSDTTNLAPAMAGTDLFTHIRHMLRTTVPAWILAMIGFALVGGHTPTMETASELGGVLSQHYSPSFWHALPPLVTLALVVVRVPALPALLVGVGSGMVVAVAAQGTALGAVLTAAVSGHSSALGHSAADELLSRGGMNSMASTVFLILCAMAFGGVMERTGMLRAIAAALLRRAQKPGSLVSTALLTSLGMNVIAADQYIALVVPGRMYADAFTQRGLDPKHLSRSLEDGGTITSPLVPWNTCGAFMAGTLGVATFAYLPWCFFNLLNPLVALVYAQFGWRGDAADSERA